MIDVMCDVIVCKLLLNSSHNLIIILKNSEHFFGG